MNYILIVLFVVLIVVLVRTFNQRRSLENEKNQLVKLVENGNLLYQQVVEENRGLKEIKHDYKKIQQIEKIANNLDELKSDKLIELIINTKKQEAESAKIKFTYTMNKIREWKISVGESISLFTNLLDNAIEAAEKTSDSFIDIKVLNNADSIVINVENSKCEKEKPMENQMSTTKHQKEEHGLGVGIIKKIVKNNQGTINMEDRGKSFFISIIL